MLLLCLFFHLLFSLVEGYFTHYEMKCWFSFKDLHDIEYTEQIFFNKKLLGEYNSLTEKCTGYTDTAKKIADAFNKDPHFVIQRRMEMEKYCRSKAPMLYKYGLESTMEPQVKLRLVKEAITGHPAVLLCSAYDFYPRPIRLTWQRNGQELTSDVTTTDELADGDWFYQIHSYLEYTPTPEEKITCMVEHPSLHEPKHYDWDPSLPESERNKIVIGASGLLLGIVFATAGLIQYRRKSIGGRGLVPITEGVTLTAVPNHQGQ